MERLFPPEKETNIPSTYTVSFNSNGGSPVESQKVHKGETAERPQNPTKVVDDITFGFVNWYDNANFTDPHYDFSTPVSANITLHAKWNEKLCTVIFESNGGREIDGLSVGEGGTASRPNPDPSRVGHTFDNWYSDPELTIKFDFNAPIMSNTTVYAKYNINTYTVSFNTDGVNPVPEAQTINHGGNVTEPDAGSKTGYSFGGWYTEKTFTHLWDFNTDTVTEDTVLYAKWEPNEAFITFTVNDIVDQIPDIEGGIIYRGGADGYPRYLVLIAPDNYDSYQWSIDRVDNYAVNGPITGTADSFTVDAENKEYNSTGRHAVYLVVYKDEVPYNKTIWVEIVALDVSTVRFDSNGGIEVASQTVVKGGTASIPDNPTRDNYGFVAWYSDEDLTTVYDFNTPVTDDITLYADWSGTVFIVTFNSNGGNDVASQTVGAGGTAKRPSPTRSGNAFLGWYSDEGLTVLYDFGTPVTVAITLYAKWTPISAEDEADFGSTLADQTLNVSSAATWNTAVATVKSGGNNKNYVINFTSTNLSNFPSVTANTFGNLTGIKVSLRGSTTLTLSGTGNMLRIRADQTVILRGLTMKGNSGNNDSPLVRVDGTFIMDKGQITGNTSTSLGGGVYVAKNATFTMNGGTISGNENKNGSGGGVCVANDATFTMNAGTISGNKASGAGGGVYVSGTFIMNGGTISGNTTASSGGGVNVIGGTFTMKGGTIQGNSANGSSAGGGGVYVTSSTFRLVTGTIYGSEGSLTTSQRNYSYTKGSSALYVSPSSTAQRGTFAANGISWTSKGTLASTDNTIKAVDGNLQ